jgi:hypothetical protein
MYGKERFQIQNKLLFLTKLKDRILYENIVYRYPKPHREQESLFAVPYGLRC